MKSPKSIREAYVEASSLLANNGILDYRSCVELLLLHVLNSTRNELFFNWNQTFPEDKQKVWVELVNRKILGEPLQYILGEQQFYGLNYQVNQAVLIPRPETELLVDEIIRHGSELFQEKIPFVADIGTGSGAIAIAIAKFCPKWIVSGCDISIDALEVAQKNESLHLLNSQIEWLQGDLLLPYVARNQNIDILAANLPYIPSADLLHLQKEVRDYEPISALIGGEDGLDVYRQLIEQLKSLSKLPNIIGLEIGIHQAKTIYTWLDEFNYWDQFKIIPDLAGIDRHVIAIRNLLS